jgi:AraC-like DNA-binding protein
MSTVPSARSSEGLTLERYPAILTRSPDEATEQYRNAYGLRNLSVTGPRSEFLIRANHKFLTDIALIYSAYGTAVELEFPQPEFARQMFCLSGKGIVQVGKTDAPFRSDKPLTLPVGYPVNFRLGANVQQFALRIDEAALIKKLTALLGSEPAGQIQLHGGEPGGEEKILLRNLVMYFARSIHSFEKSDVFIPVVRELEQAIITAFLYTNHHNYSDLLRADSKDVGPWQVRAVEEYIESHWNEPIDISQLVKITGASARSIFQAFARARGYSPKVFLKRTRLAQARTKLQSGDPNASVTAIALSCGFHNVGRFASEYRARFGELPSETLARRRTKRP